MPSLVDRLAVAVLVLAVAGCAGETAADSPATSTPAAPSSQAPPFPTPTATPPIGQPSDAALRAELLAMLAADQKSRRSAGTEGIAGDQDRTDRLKAIIAAQGWPTRTAVGADGATAAWVIAQHSDLDPEFQRLVLELMHPAVAAGEASPGDLAYLTDRVAANAGQPQTYGTQLGCTPDGKPGSPEVIDPANLDRRRADAGLPPMAAYVAEMAEVCAEG